MRWRTRLQEVVNHHHNVRVVWISSLVGIPSFLYVQQHDERNNVCCKISSSSQWENEDDSSVPISASSSLVMQQQKYSHFLPSELLRYQSSVSFTQMEPISKVTSATTNEMKQQQQREQQQSDVISTSVVPSFLENVKNIYNSNKVKEYDFIVIGYGNAGRSVVRTLQQYCPDATIAVIDPIQSQQQQQQSSFHDKKLTKRSNINSNDDSRTTTTSARKKATSEKSNSGDSSDTSNVYFYANHRAVGINPRNRIVEYCNDNNSNSSKHCYIKYKHTICIASGSHGAPIPNYLVDENIRNHIYELRPTSSSSATTTTDGSSQSPSQQQHKQLTANEIRNQILSINYSSDSSSLSCDSNIDIGILGSGWDAIELAVAASIQNSRSKAKRNVSLIFGSYGPLAHVVPPYLCVAISKRLKSKGIDINDRRLIRYIAVSNDRTTATNNNDNNGDATNVKANVYTAKSYDLMDGDRTTYDRIIVAPEVCGIRGNATTPITKNIVRSQNNETDSPGHIDPNNNNTVRNWYKTWSQLSTSVSPNESSESSSTSNAMIVCYHDDGRIAVNPELRACSGVYAVGSVAKFANGLTGHATVAGYGIEDASRAGEVAAHNMSRHYCSTVEQHDRTNNGGILTNSISRSSSRHGNRSRSTGSIQNSDDFVRTIDPIPIWRSDILQHACPSGDDDSSMVSSSLNEIGINALFVGNCDAERLATHGVWWTNQSFEQRLMRQYESDNAEKSVDGEYNDRTGSIRSRRTKLSRRSKPVYGIGVVFYIDRKSGQIQGIMTWGLPITEGLRSKKLNQRLVQQMKQVLTVNGGFLGSIESENDYMRVSSYFAEKGKDVVRTAFSSASATSSLKSLSDDASAQNHMANTVGNAISLSRPLHRVSEVKPVASRNASVLRRKDGFGQGVLGEDMYARSYFDDYSIESHTTNIITLTGNEVGSAGSDATKAKVKALNDWAIYLKNEQKWDDNESQARPPKEDPLWIRKGDDNRSISAKDTLNEAYRALLFS